MPKAAKAKTGAKEGGRKKKDPNAPKKALTAYMLFAQEKRPEIKAANPDAGFGDMGKLVGAAWKNLSDAEKKKYQDKADVDKLRYERESGAAKKKDEDKGEDEEEE
ncbi:Non-histone chromosomal protein 6 [Gonapodya sp. JEL0774]|nr:Non-histone chromosomal protein 6 [Gonapodya sp. JEL0774]